VRVARLLLFGPAREEAGLRGVEIAGHTVGAVLNEAQCRFGERFARIVGTSQIWVNGEAADRLDSVNDADEVAVLPPVSGG
jgi:molybdopterin converting factor small subunit